MLHTRDRLIESGRKELVTLKWFCCNFCAFPRTIRNYFMTRCLQKFAYGTPVMLKLLHPDFYAKYEDLYIVKDGAI